jgi:uncharacterized protein (DUF697 family)
MSTENTIEPAVQARSAEAQNLVKNYVIVAVGLGLVPVPAADLAALMALEVKLVHGLAKQFDVPFKESLGKSVIFSLLSGGTSVAAVMGLGSLAKAVPVLGTLGGGASVGISAGAITYAVGEVFIRHFESGGTLLTFDSRKTRDLFENKVKEGMDVARNLRKNTKAEEAAAATVGSETTATGEADIAATT